MIYINNRIMHIVLQPFGCNIVVGYKLSIESTILGSYRSILIAKVSELWYGDYVKVQTQN